MELEEISRKLAKLGYKEESEKLAAQAKDLRKREASRGSGRCASASRTNAESGASMGFTKQRSRATGRM